MQARRKRRDARSIKIDRGLPLLDPLCDLQAALAAIYAELHASVIKLQAQASGTRATALEMTLHRLRVDAIWAVTEVDRDDEFKLRRQRFISQGVFDRWAKVCRQERMSFDAFNRDGDNKKLVHEHVVRIESVTPLLTALIDADDIKAELLKLKACVVTRAEDARLEKRGGNGWERYENAKDGRIGVYDRLLNVWFIDRS